MRAERNYIATAARSGKERVQITLKMKDLSWILENIEKVIVEVQLKSEDQSI